MLKDGARAEEINRMSTNELFELMGEMGAWYLEETLYDYWGNPLNVKASDSDYVSVCGGSSEKVIEGRVAVWSNGKNQLNDCGSGDDIVSWLGVTEQKSRLGRLWW